MLVKELKLDANVIGQCALPAADDDGDEEQAAFVDQASGQSLAGELCSADRDVAACWSPLVGRVSQ